MSFSQYMSCGCLALALLACGSSPSSHIKGHYEESDAEAMARFKGQQQVPGEYAPVTGVIVSETLFTSYGREDLVAAILEAGVEKVWVTVPRASGRTLQSANFRRLRDIVGSDLRKVELVSQTDSGPLSVWARDWSPLGALTSSGDLHLLDFNYYPSRPADDSTGRALAGFKGVPRVSVPVYNEGGNFMSNEDGDCLMTSRVTDANSQIFKANDMILDVPAIQAYYRDFAGCQQTVIFPRMPNERTGHIDMWAKFLDNDTVIVSEITEQTLASARNQRERSFAEQIRGYVDARADDLEALGYRVVKIPMPLPRPGLFRSYTNSLLVNGTAIVPQYRSLSEPDSELLESYEQQVSEIYQAAGYRVVLIPSDELIAAGGAVHCVTMQVPKGR